MATRTERTLEKHGKKVVSIKDKIKEYEEMLRAEENKEREAKNMAVVELVRNMNMSYEELKNAINLVNSSLNSTAPEKPVEPLTDVPQLEPVLLETAVFSKNDKEKNVYEEIN